MERETMNDHMSGDTIVEVEGRAEGKLVSTEEPSNVDFIYKSNVMENIDKHTVIKRLQIHIESLRETKRKADIWLDHDAEYNLEMISSAANIPNHLLDVSDIESVMDSFKSDSEACEKLIDFYESAISKIIDGSIKIYANELSID